MGLNEADITIGGVRLTRAQSMTLRVAVSRFAMDMSDDVQRRELGPIGDAYFARLCELERLIVMAIRK